LLYWYKSTNTDALRALVLVAGAIEVREGQNLGKLARAFCASHAQLLAATNTDAHTGAPQVYFFLFLFFLVRRTRISWLR
jgi:hypothetical protein